MNTPNKLTVLRMITVPFFLAVALINFKHNYLIALILFCLASLTDWFDGMLARKHNLITNFGKFLDPLADKMLTTAALLAFIKLEDAIPGALVIAFITLFREFVVSGVRLSAVADGGKVIAANIWGKLKTVSQMFAIIILLFAAWLIKEQIAGQVTCNIINTLGVVLLWVSALLTIISGVIYVVDNAKFIDFRK